MANALIVTLQDGALTAGAFTGSAVDLGDNRQAVDLELVATAVTGSVDTSLETSPDGSTGWRQAGNFRRVSAIGGDTLVRDGCDRYVRVTGTVTTGPVTVKIAGTAHQLHVRWEDVLDQITPGALNGVDADTRAKKLIATSLDIENAFNTGHVLPIDKSGRDVRERGAEIALWRIIRARGLQPQGADVELLKMAHDDALKWLEKIMMGKIRPQASAAQQDFGPKYSSGNAATPTCFQTRMSDDFGDF